MGIHPQLSNTTRKTLLILSCVLLGLGTCGGVLTSRLYFVRGGTRTWLSTWLMAGGWPISVIPLVVSYFYRRKTDRSNAKLVTMKVPVFVSAMMIGVLMGLANYLSAFGVQRLPLSTATLILSTSIVFTALSAFFLVKQKFTAYSINAIVLLTVGAAVLALHAGSDRPREESKRSYVFGFIMALSASALSGVILPVIELVYKKSKQTIVYTLVMEFQVIMSISATVFPTVGMLINNDFKAISREARQFRLGEAKYYVVLVSNAILWQFYALGAFGVIFCTSALVSGILVTMLLPVSQILSVIFFHDKFSAEKGIALVLCLWGFVSYYYGEFKASKKTKDGLTPENSMDSQDQESEMIPTAAP